MKTCWDSYYRSPAFFAKITRSFTSSWLVKNIIKYCSKRHVSIAELGGGNSSFAKKILSSNKIQVLNYTIYDNNKLGISMFMKQYKKQKNIYAIEADLLHYNLPENCYDIVFSIGLVEHFSQKDTQKIIIQHFKTAKKDGLVIITAPTPTLLYTITRKVAEASGIWGFPDERPLEPYEIRNIAKEHGEILCEQILYFTILTQYAIIIKK